MGDRDHHEACNTSLQLGLGLGGYAPRKDMAVKTIRERDDKQPPVVCLDLSFALFPKEENITSLSSGHPRPNGPSFMKRKIIEEYEEQRYPADRRSGDLTPESKIINTENGARKKLRLTKEQTTLLENSFKRHSTLNPTQKQALAGQLNLKPRQVEVWFQNRRARTKLKQTEVDCEFLKKLCENLDNENRKLNEELEELKSVSMLTMCSSCGKIIEADHDQHDVSKQLQIIKADGADS